VSLPIKNVPSESAGVSPRPGKPVAATFFHWRQLLEPDGPCIRWSVVSTETNQECICEILPVEDNELYLALASNAIFCTQTTPYPGLARTLHAGWLPDGNYYQIIDLPAQERRWIDARKVSVLSEAEFLKAAIHLVQAMIRMHKDEMLHTALNPFCLRITAHGNVCISDFWWARNLAGKPFYQDILPFYPDQLPFDSRLCMAPELLAHGLPSRESDLFSLGCVFFFLLTGEYPRYLEDNRESMFDFSQLAQAPLKNLLQLRPDLGSNTIAAVELALSYDSIRRESPFAVLSLLQIASGAGQEEVLSE
jgi:hypothetical protein